MNGVEYVVVLKQIVGSPEAFKFVYSADRNRSFSTRRAAISRGLQVFDHDDFLLAHLRGDRLVMVSWQYETQELLVLLRQWEVRAAVRLDRLKPVRKAMEWWKSCDWSEGQFRKALEEYRGEASE